MVIDLGVIWKGIISGVWMPNMKPLSHGWKVIVKLKIDNRQSEQNQYAPDL